MDLKTAIKDIQKGQEITVCYLDKVQIVENQ